MKDRLKKLYVQEDLPKFMDRSCHPGRGNQATKCKFTRCWSAINMIGESSCKLIGRMSCWKIGISRSYDYPWRERPWQVRLNAEGIATGLFSSVARNVATHRVASTQLGQSGAVTKVASRGFSDTAVIVHLTVYIERASMRIVAAEGLSQKRCHEQRNHVHIHTRRASALVSCDPSTFSLSMFSSILL